MFSSPLDLKLKNYLYDNLSTNPEGNVSKVLETVRSQIRSSDFDNVKEVMKIIKFMIKDKIRAKVKYYALIILKEIMKSQI